MRNCRSASVEYTADSGSVGDVGAKAFTETFYKTLVAGKPIGDAVAAGRKKIRAKRVADWADYIHFGNPSFLLKYPGAAKREVR